MYNEMDELLYDIYFQFSEPQDIKHLGFVEDWYFDTLTLSIRKDVKGVIPYKQTFNDDTGEFIGHLPMYYYKYKD